MVELTVRLGPKGQVVIPKLLRDHFKLYPGEQVVIEETSKGVLIKPIEQDIVAAFEIIAEKATKYRKGKPFVYDKQSIYEDIDARAQRAGVR